MLDKSVKHSITKEAGELNNDTKVKPSHALLNFSRTGIISLLLLSSSLQIMPTSIHKQLLHNKNKLIIA